VPSSLHSKWSDGYDGQEKRNSGTRGCLSEGEGSSQKTEEGTSSSAIEDFPGRCDTPTFTNQFYISVGPHTTRLSLGEYAFNGQVPNYYFTTVMTTPVAVDLARKILKLAKDQDFIQSEIEEPDPLG
jgi:hypothetical protein